MRNLRSLSMLLAPAIALLGAALPAAGATLTMSFDKSVYSVGETITLTATGDSEGGVDNAILGSIDFSDTLVSVTSANQNTLTSFVGAIAWVGGGLILLDSDTQVSFNQLV